MLDFASDLQPIKCAPWFQGRTCLESPAELILLALSLGSNRKLSQLPGGQAHWVRAGLPSSRVQSRSDPFLCPSGSQLIIVHPKIIPHLCVSVAQSCPTLCNPIDYSLPGSFVHGILQAVILEWVAVPFSRGSSQPRDWTQVSRIAGEFFSSWTTWEAGMYRKKKSYFFLKDKSQTGKKNIYYASIW